MQQTFNRLRLIFLTLFVLGVAASVVYQVLWLKPERACLARGNWWSARSRTCAVPIDITAITGRPRGAPAPTPAAAPSRPALPAR